MSTTGMNSRVDELEQTIAGIIGKTDAEFGVYLRHVESGATLSVNGRDLYPLASVVKVPILVAALAQVDEGSISLTERIELRQEAKVLPSGVLVTLEPGLQPTFHDLLMLMIIISDNTATDMVLERIGLPNVEARLTTLALDEIAVKLSIADLFRATFEPLDVSLPVAERRRLRSGQKTNWDSLAAQRTTANNVASPRGMGILFEHLLAGKLLSPRSTEVALEILMSQQLNDRIPRFLPDDAVVAHKTGTFLNTRDDAGIIYLPDGNHLVLSTFALLRRDLLEEDATVRRPYIDGVDAAMGRIARAAYDAFVPLTP